MKWHSGFASWIFLVLYLYGVLAGALSRYLNSKGLSTDFVSLLVYLRCPSIYELVLRVVRVLGLLLLG